MDLPLPIVGVQTGPLYATDLNNCLTIVDGHDHTPGYGVPVPSDGININSDLPFSNHNLTSLRTVRFQSQSAALSAAADVGCLYEVDDDLYYNDGAGNQVRITQSGSVAGSSGTITGLPSGTASASYNSLSGTFIFQSATATPAYVDCASVLIRNFSANSNALTLQAPAAMAADYSLTLPPLPASQKIMTLDSSGNMTAPYTVDGSTITISSNVIGVPNSGIGTNQLAALSVTAAKIANATITTTQISASAGILGSQLSSSAGIVGTQLASGTISATQLASDSVTTAKIAAGAVTGTKIASATIVGSNIANSAITNALLAPSAVTGAKIDAATIDISNMAANSVGTTQLVDANVTSAKIASNINLPGTAVQANSKNLIVSNTNASTNLSIIRVRVSSAGAVIVGEGVTSVANPGTGLFDVNFTTAFSGTPIGVASCGQGHVASVKDFTTTSLRVVVQDFAGGLVNESFTLIVIGPT